MLEALRQNSRNVVIYVLFGIIIAAFIISFGPGSRGLGSVGAPAASWAAKVEGNQLSEQDFLFAYIALGGTQLPPQMAHERHLKEFVMDKLIERELFVKEGERLGLAASDKEVEDMIADGRMTVMGVPRRVDSYVFKDGKFDYDRFKMVSQNQLGVSVKRFIEIERREMLADKTKEFLQTAVKVSPDEVKSDFEQKGREVNLEFVRFSTRAYESEGELSTADLDAYVAKHGDELKKMYDERSFLFTKIDRQARLRHIVVDVPKDAPAATVDAAKKKIDDAAAQLKAGAKFGDVAKAVSADERSKRRGGVIGWRKKGFTTLGDALDEKVFAAKPGTLIGPEKTDRGFELVQVDNFREGDVPLADAERELAEDKLRDDNAKEGAKSAAEAALAKIKAGAKLEALYPPPSDADEAKAGADDQPHVKETGLFSRHGDLITDVGVQKELARRAFATGKSAGDALTVGQVVGPFDVAGGEILVRLKEKKEPDLADYDKRKDDLLREFQRTKWAETLDSWSRDRCVAARDAGRIRVNDEVLRYEGFPEARLAGATKSGYQPCSKMF